MREKRFVLKADVGEAMALPQLLQLGSDADRFEAVPAAAVDRGIRAEGAPEAASLRRGVVDLARLLQRKVPLDVDERVIVLRQIVDVARRARRIDVRRGGGAGDA